MCSNLFPLSSFNFTTEQFDSDLEQYSDFEIICDETDEKEKQVEKHFKCHKIILASRSKIFNTMFLSSFSEAQGSTKVTDISSKTMAIFLQYLYTGELKKEDITEELLYAAHKYEIGPLAAKVELELCRKIDIETCPKLAAAANLCGSKAMKEYVFRFVGRCWKEMKEEDRLNWIGNDANTLASILNYI